MGLFEKTTSEAKHRGLDFLVTGGLAVNLHGYSRETGDLDLLICGEERSSWVTEDAPNKGSSPWHRRFAPVSRLKPTGGKNIAIYSHVGRYSNHLLDVEALVRKHKLDLNSEK